MDIASKILLAFSILIPGIISQCTIEHAEPYFRRSVHEFSSNLVKRISQEMENHFVTSGISPWILLSAVYLGATDETLDEIKKVLRLHPHQCFNNKFFEIVYQMKGGSEDITFERSSTLFVDNRFELNDVFKRKVQRTRVCSVQSLEFQEFTETANTINDIVSRATHGAIDDIISPSDLDGVYLVLVDALYFKGTWRYKFLPEDTEVSAFYDENGNQIGDVNLMFATETTNLVSIPSIGAAVLELPYGKDDRFSMLIILPNSGHSVTSVIEKLDTITLSSIFTLFEQQIPSSVMIQIPRFKISSDLTNLKELLRDMGLRTLFDSSAKLSDISDFALYISNLIQKANIEVTEEGSEASVTTAAFFQGRSASPDVEQFVANKPFVFMIVDKETEVALFTGAYSKPSVY